MNRQRIMEVVNAAKPNDPVSRMCDILLSILIILNLIAVCLESVETINQKFGLALLYFEIFSVSIFAFEYVLRIWSAADNLKLRGKSALRKRFAYISSPTGLIDLMAILPSILPLIFGGIDLRWLRVLRLVRLLKISHYSSALEDFFSALYEERKSFFATIYLLAIALFLSSSLVYLAEYEIQPEKFKSIPHAMWWSLITLDCRLWGCFANHTTWQIGWSFHCIDGCLYGSTANRDSRIGLCQPIGPKKANV